MRRLYPSISRPGLLAPPGVERSDIVDQIRKLAELRDAGILTEVEFDAKKVELLAKLEGSEIRTRASVRSGGHDSPAPRLHVWRFQIFLGA